MALAPPPSCWRPQSLLPKTDPYLAAAGNSGLKARANSIRVRTRHYVSGQVKATHFDTNDFLVIIYLTIVLVANTIILKIYGGLFVQNHVMAVYYWQSRDYWDGTYHPLYYGPSMCAPGNRGHDSISLLLKLLYASFWKNGMRTCWLCSLFLLSFLIECQS